MKNSSRSWTNATTELYAPLRSRPTSNLRHGALMVLRPRDALLLAYFGPRIFFDNALPPRDARVGKRGGEGGQGYGQRRHDRTAHPFPPSVRPCDQPGHLRAKVDHHPFQIIGHGRRHEHKPEVAAHELVAASRRGDGPDVFLTDHRRGQRPARVQPHPWDHQQASRNGGYGERDHRSNEDAGDERGGLDKVIEHAPQAVALLSPTGFPDDPLSVRQIEVISDVGGHHGEDLVQPGSTLHEVGGNFTEATEHRGRRERRQGVPPDDRQRRPPHAPDGVSLAHAPAYSRPGRDLSIES